MLKYMLVICLLVVAFACKKKEDEKPPAPPPAPVVPVGRANVFTAKLNGTAWTVSGNQTAEAKIDVGIVSGSPKQYVFMGKTSSSLYKNSIHIWTPYALGTLSLRSDSSSAIYFDATGYAFYIKSGTITISTMDTSHVKSANCDKLKATFSFVTDSVGGVGYTIDEGVIDFEAP